MCFTVTKTELRLDIGAHGRRSRSSREEEPGSGPPARSRSEHNIAAASRTDTRKKPANRQHSYQLGTQSSKAKMSKASSTTNLTADATSRPGSATSSPRKIGASRRGRLSVGHKAKFKSTPDLASLQDDEDDVTILSPQSKTTEDLNLGSSENLLGKPTSSKMLSRRSMPASRNKRNLFTYDNTHSSSDSSTDFDRMHPSSSSSPPPPLPSSLPPAGDSMTKEAQDRRAMPPPPSISTLSRAKQDAFLKKATNSRTLSGQDLTLAQAKAILLGKPGLIKTDSIDSDSASSQADSRHNSSQDEELGTRTRKLLPQPPLEDTVGNRSQTNLDPSPNELPVKDSSKSVSRNIPDNSKYKSGRVPSGSSGRTSPFVGSIRDTFEPGRARSESPMGRVARKLPAEPFGSTRSEHRSVAVSETCEGSPRTVEGSPPISRQRLRSASPIKIIKDTRSTAMGDIFRSSDSSESSESRECAVSEGQERAGSEERERAGSEGREEKVFETSVFDRVQQFEQKSPSPGRRHGVANMSGSRWRQRLVQVGEGDEAGMGDVDSSSSSPLGSPLSPAKSWERHTTVPGSNMPKSSTDPGLYTRTQTTPPREGSRTSYLSPTRGQPSSGPTSPMSSDSSGPPSPTRSVTVTIQGRQRTLVSYTSQGRRHTEPPKQVSWRDIGRDRESWRSSESPARVETISEGTLRSPTRQPDRTFVVHRSSSREHLSGGGEGDVTSPVREAAPTSVLKQRSKSVSSLGGEPDYQEEPPKPAEPVPMTMSSRVRPSVSEDDTLRPILSPVKEIESNTTPTGHLRVRPTEGTAFKQTMKEADPLMSSRQRMRPSLAAGQNSLTESKQEEPQSRYRVRPSQHGEPEESAQLSSGRVRLTSDGNTTATGPSKPNVESVTPKQTPPSVQSSTQPAGSQSRKTPPSSSQVQTAAPSNGQHRTAVPSSGHPQTTVPSSGQPETSVSSSGKSRTIAQSQPKAPVPSIGQTSVTVPSSGQPHAKVPSSGQPQTAVPSSGQFQTAVPSNSQHQAAIRRRESNGQEGEDEVKRPDKSRQSPLTSLNTTVPKDINKR